MKAAKNKIKGLREWNPEQMTELKEAEDFVGGAHILEGPPGTSRPLILTATENRSFFEVVNGRMKVNRVKISARPEGTCGSVPIV